MAPIQDGLVSAEPTQLRTTPCDQKMADIYPEFSRGWNACLQCVIAELSAPRERLMESISADVHTGDCGDPVWLDDEGRAMIVNSHHYTAENICALIAELKRFEDPQQSTQADWDNKDWRTMCGVLWHVMAGLANEVPLASRPFGWALVPVNPTVDMLFAGDTALYRASYGELDPAPEEMKAAYLAMLASAPTPANGVSDTDWQKAMLDNLDFIGLQAPDGATPAQILAQIIAWYTQYERDFNPAFAAAPSAEPRTLNSPHYTSKNITTAGAPNPEKQE